MDKYESIAIGNFRGNGGRELADGVKSRLTADGSSGLKVMDRAHLRQIVREARLNSSVLVDRNEAIQLGKHIPAAILMTGRYERRYTESMKIKKMTCQNLSGKKWDCREYRRIATVNTRGNVDVVDVETGVILKSKKISRECRTEKRKVNEVPERMNRELRFEECLASDVRTVARMVQPWTEIINVPFRTDDDMPELEEGINLLKVGEVSSAIEKFNAAIANGEGSGETDKEALASAYWNVGLVYEYTGRYQKAIESFKRGFLLDPDDEFIEEINKCKKWRAENG